MVSDPPHEADAPTPRPVDGPEVAEFDPDAVLEQLRAREAMEILRRREHAGGVPLAAAVGESLLTPAGEALVAAEVPSAHWTRSPEPAAPSAWPASGRLPFPDLAEDISTLPPAAAEDDAPEGDADPAAPLLAVDPADPRFETPDDPRIPSGRDSFRIGEAARIVGVKPHVLRFWETEFACVEPVKTSANQRRYRRADLARLLQIRRLRHDANLTVAQTRASLDEALRTGQSPRVEPAPPRVAPTAHPAATAPGALGLGELRRRLEDMRRTVVQILEAVED